MICVEEGCERNRIARRSRCGRCYRKYRIASDPNYLLRTQEARRIRDAQKAARKAAERAAYAGQTYPMQALYEALKVTRFGIVEVVGNNLAGEVVKWEESGMPWQYADVAAIRLGSHPALIWPTWIEDGMALADD